MVFKKKEESQETFTEAGFVKPKNKGGRPRVYVRKTEVTRETRVPLDGIQDPLAIQGTDPNYHYHWEIDSDEAGTRILALERAGYEFVQSREVSVSKVNVYSSHDVGSIVRIPNKDGRFLYLMKIPMDYWLADQKAQQQRVNEMEAQQKDANLRDGGYGGVLEQDVRITSPRKK